MNKPRRQHFVTFLSPGTLFNEETTKPIESWDILTAVAMSKRVTERHGAKPYGFRFTTSIVADPIQDGEGGALSVEPRQVESSGIYFLGGRLRTVDEVRAEGNEGERILLSNMEGNDFAIVVDNTNSYKSTMPFGEEDVLLSPDGSVTSRGDSPEHVAYRVAKKAEHEAELAKWRASRV